VTYEIYSNIYQEKGLVLQKVDCVYSLDGLGQYAFGFYIMCNFMFFFKKVKFSS